MKKEVLVKREEEKKLEKVDLFVDSHNSSLAVQNNISDSKLIENSVLKKNLKDKKINSLWDIDFNICSLEKKKSRDFKKVEIEKENIVKLPWGEFWNVLEKKKKDVKIGSKMNSRVMENVKFDLFA